MGGSFVGSCFLQYDKCWAGTCLLGLTCQECSTDHFLASYSVWFHKLLSHIQVDLLLITIATDACEGGWADDERVISLPNDATSTRPDFQLAALRALLASLLSPARVQPPYLAQGLELFCRGKQETGTRLAEFCTHALFALEVLIHPRALPLEDFPTVNCNSFDNGANHNYPENMYSGGQDLNTPFSRGPLGMALGVPNPDYDLYDKWLGSDDEIDTPVTDSGENRNNVEEASESFRDHWTEKLPSADGASSTKVAKKIDHRSAAAGADMREGGTGEEIMVESHQFPESISQEESPFPAVVSASTSTKIEIGKVASDSGALDPGDSEIATGNDVLVAKGDSFLYGEKILPLQYQILKEVKDLCPNWTMNHLWIDFLILWIRIQILIWNEVIVLVIYLEHDTTMNPVEEMVETCGKRKGLEDVMELPVI